MTELIDGRLAQSERIIWWDIIKPILTNYGSTPPRIY